MEQTPSWEAISQLVKKFPASYGNRRFTIVFTTTHHWSLSWSRCVQSTSSHSISVRSVLILSSHLRPHLPSGIFPSDFRRKFCMHYSYPINATFRAHLILLDVTTLIIFVEAWKLRSSSLCSFLQPPVTSSLFGPNVRLSSLFSNTPNL